MTDKQGTAYRVGYLLGFAVLVPFGLGVEAASVVWQAYVLHKIWLWHFAGLLAPWPMVRIGAALVSLSVVRIGMLPPPLKEPPKKNWGAYLAVLALGPAGALALAYLLAP